MIKQRNTMVASALTVALVVTGLSVAPAANATEADRPATAGVVPEHRGVTAEVWQQAIAEARAAGAVQREEIDEGGTRVVVIGTPSGASLELGDARAGSRLGSGSDGYGGRYVAFNAFDQNLIISGAMTAIAAGMCALGPAVCVVANVAALLAGNAIGNGGGVRCGTKSLRVYPVSRKAPRCA